MVSSKHRKHKSKEVTIRQPHWEDGGEEVSSSMRQIDNNGREVKVIKNFRIRNKGCKAVIYQRVDWGNAIQHVERNVGGSSAELPERGILAFSGCEGNLNPCCLIVGRKEVHSKLLFS